MKGRRPVAQEDPDKFSGERTSVDVHIYRPKNASTTIADVDTVDVRAGALLVFNSSGKCLYVFGPGEWLTVGVPPLKKDRLRHDLQVKKSAKAADLAEQTVDRLIDPAAPQEEREQRKRRLIKGPGEFRDIRSKGKG